MNKQNTNQLEIRIDGQLQTPTVTEQAIYIGNTILSHVEASTAALVGKVGQVFTPAILDYHDARNGSNLRTEYFSRKRELAIAAVRDEYEF